VTRAGIQQTLARLSRRPPAEWAHELEAAFPDDPAARRQALLWLHAERQRPELEGEPPSLGEAAAQRYELAVRLDTGSTASVWQAFDRKLGRNVAIKVFHEEGESEVLEQVLAEARAASDVVSDHVVRVLDVHHDHGHDHGHPYIVMELVGEYDPEQGELVLGSASAAARPRSIAEVARWTLHVARGVHDAHLRNVFHRDLKPKNVLVTPHSRRARVADFGLAVSGANTDVAHPAMMLLRRGPGGPVSVRGTPEYMAPEQARGLPLSLDPRAAADREVLAAIDVWGIGAIAYDLLAGRPPWLPRPAEDRSAWELAASGAPPPRLERTASGERIPARLRRIVEKAMAIDPAARYATAAAVANDLQAFLERRPTTLDRARALRLGLWCRRNPQLALTALAAVVLTLLTLGARQNVERLRGERDELYRESAQQLVELVQLSEGVEVTRRALDGTRARLAAERQSLAGAEKALAEARAAYDALRDAKERALEDANAATRQLLEKLEETRREQRDTEQARLSLQQLVESMRRDAERAAKDRDRIRRERDAARAERDAVQRERDAAIAEREGIEQQLRGQSEELARVRAARGESARVDGARAAGSAPGDGARAAGGATRGDGARAAGSAPGDGARGAGSAPGDGSAARARLAP